MELSNLMSIFNIIINIFGKISFLALCIYLGNMAFKGWKNKMNIFLKIILILLFGIIAFFGGLIVKEYFNLNFILSEYVSSIVIALTLFILISMISTGFNVKNKYATKMDLNAILDDLKEMKIQIAKLTKALEDENITPKELTEEDIKKNIKSQLEKKGIKSSIISLTKNIDYWIVKLSDNKEAIVDSYTGKINEVIKKTNSFEILYKKPFFTIGSILMITLLIFLAININSSVIESFTDVFDFSFLATNELLPGCIKASLLLENVNESDLIINNSLNNSIISQEVFELTNTYVISDKTRMVNYNNSNYIIASSYNEITNNLGSKLSENPTDNIYNVRVCVLKENYGLCECIGGEQTDAVFTVPYLMKLDLISEAIQGLIFDSISGLIGI